MVENSLKGVKYMNYMKNKGLIGFFVGNAVLRTARLIRRCAARLKRRFAAR
jgi:hypothetical protein